MKQKSTFLKVMSILMIIGGGFEVVAALMSLAAVGVLALAGASAGPLYAAAALVAAAAVVYLTAGIQGLKACKAPEKRKKCMIWGVLAIVLLVTGNVIQGIWGDGVAVESLLSGLVLPVLYLAALMKQGRNGMPQTQDACGRGAGPQDTERNKSHEETNT